MINLFFSLFLSSAFAQLVGVHCQIKITKQAGGNNSNTSFGIDANGKPIAVSHESTSSSSEVSQLILGINKSASINVTTQTSMPTTTVSNGVVINSNQILNHPSTVFITCSGGNNNMYDLKIALDSEKSKLSTDISISKGSKISLGSVITDINTKNKTLDLSKGATLNLVDGDKQVEYWLEIE